MKNHTNLFSSQKSEKKFIPRTDPGYRAGARPKPKKYEPLTIFLIALVINLGVVYVLNFVWVIGEMDALSTTANGLLTLYSANTGMMPITLVDPPLTGLLQLVFIPILKEFQLTFLAGPILSAIAGALSLIFLNMILLQMHVKPAFRWILLALVQISPSFLYSSATGTSDALFLFVVLFVIWGALQIAYKNISFLICGFGLAIGFFIRYESLAIAVGLVLALVIYTWKSKDNWQVELEGQFIAFITPIIYVIVLWLVFGVFNMNDAFYFLKHLNTLEYAADISKNVVIFHPFYLGWNNIFEATKIGIDRVVESSMVLTVTTIFAFIIALVNRKKYYFSVLMIILTLPVLDIIQIFLGLQSPGFYQWAYAVPFGMVLVGLLSQETIPEKRHWLLILTIVLTIVLTIASVFLTLDSLSADDVSISEQRLAAIISGDDRLEVKLRNSDPYWIYRHDGPIVALEIESMDEEDALLINASDVAPITLFIQNPDQILVTTGIDFASFFTYPGNEVDKLLLLQEEQPVNTAYALQDYPVFSETSVSFLDQLWESADTILNWNIFELKNK